MTSPSKFSPLQRLLVVNFDVSLIRLNSLSEFLMIHMRYIIKVNRHQVKKNDPSYSTNNLLGPPKSSLQTLTPSPSPAHLPPVPQFLILLAPSPSHPRPHSVPQLPILLSSSHSHPPPCSRPPTPYTTHSIAFSLNPSHCTPILLPIYLAVATC